MPKGQNLNPNYFGAAVICSDHSEPLYRLLTGAEINLNDLEILDQSIRSILLYDKLFCVEKNKYGEINLPDGSYPLGDGEVDFEFSNELFEIPYAEIHADEEAFYKQTLVRLIESWVSISQNGGVATNVDGLKFIDEIIGIPVFDEEYFSGLSSYYENNNVIIKKFGSRPVDVQFLVDYCEEILGSFRFIVNLYRSGACYVSNDKFHEMTKNHLFYKWPMKLFESFYTEYSKFIDELKSPDISFYVPPFLSLILSIAENRREIGRTIINLRESLKDGRMQLWDLSHDLYFCEKKRDQFEILKQLKDVSNNMFKSIFTEKFDCLNLGIELAPISFSGLTGALKYVKEFDKPHSIVSSLGFTKILSQKFRNELVNDRETMWKHLSASERKKFGLS